MQRPWPTTIDVVQAIALLLAVMVITGWTICNARADEPPKRYEMTVLGSIPAPFGPYRLGWVKPVPMSDSEVAQMIAMKKLEWEHEADEARAKEESRARNLMRAIGIPALVAGLIGMILGAYLAIKGSDKGEDLLILGALAAGAGGTLILYPRQGVWVLGGLLGGVLAYAVWKRVRQAQARAQKQQVEAAAGNLVNSVDTVRATIGNEAWLEKIAPVLKAAQSDDAKALVKAVQLKAKKP